LLLQRVADTELCAVSESMHCSRFGKVVRPLFVVQYSLNEVGRLRRLLLLAVLLAVNGGTVRADLLFGGPSGGT